MKTLLTTSFIVLLASTGYGFKDCNRMISGLTLKDSIRIHINQVKSLYDSGLQNKDIIGLHGTSLEGLKIALVTGSLPNGDAGVKGFQGGIYMAEISARLPKRKIRTPARYGFTKAYEIAEGSAKMRTDMFSLGRALKISYSATLFENFDHLFDSYEQRDIDDEINKTVLMVKETLHISDKELEAAIHLARKDAHEGIILAIGKSILSDRNFEVVDTYPDQGFLIRPLGGADGIPLRHFTGLKALGEPEIDFLDRLKGGNP